MRTLADWVVRQRLLTIPGVSQVFTMGGGRKQFQVLVDPDAMLRYGVTLHDVKQAVAESNENATGGYLDEQGPNEFLVRSLGRVQSVEDLKKVVVTIRDGRPVLLAQVARVVEGAQVKRGDSSAFVTAEGTTDASFQGGPAVVLTINKQPKADTRDVTDEIMKALDELQPSLPDDIRIQPELYSQKSFIDRAIENVVEALRDGGILVVDHPVPVPDELPHDVHHADRDPAVDRDHGARLRGVRVVDQHDDARRAGGRDRRTGRRRHRRCGKHLPPAQGKPPSDQSEEPAAGGVSGELRNSQLDCLRHDDRRAGVPSAVRPVGHGRPAVHPAGRGVHRFDLSSLLVSLTLTPVLCYWLLAQKNVWPSVAAVICACAVAGASYWWNPQPHSLPDYNATEIFAWLAQPAMLQHLAATVIGAPLLWLLVMRLDRWEEHAEEEKDGPLLRVLKWAAGGVIAMSIRFSNAVLLIAVAAVLIALLLLVRLDRDFLPPFNEGVAQLNVVLPPGTSLRKSNEIAGTVMQRLEKIDGVAAFSRRTGRAELDEHAEGVNITEILISFDPNVDRSREEVLEDIRDAMADIPGIVTTVEQPMAHLISHMLSGVKAQVGIKIYGDDLNILRQKAREMAAAMEQVEGVKDLLVEPQVEIPQLRIELDRDKLQQYGLTPVDVNDYISTAMNGEVVSEVLLGQRTFDLLVRMDEKYREDTAALKRLSIELPGGGTTPLSSVANIYKYTGPNTINREKVRRRITVQCNVGGRGLVDVVEEIQQKQKPIIASLPPGYFVEYGGQFESQQSASRVIGVLFAISMLGVFMVLFTLFRSANFSLQVMAALPMAFIGSVAALVLTGQTLTIAAMVGFISLGGIASRNGILLLNHYLHLVRYEGETWSREMIVRAGKERLAPVLMTALTSGIGLVPLALSAGEAGKEILYPVATVIIGGLLSSTLLEFFVRPALFWKFGRGAGERIAATNWMDVKLVEEEEEEDRPHMATEVGG